jgi:hypothetical protein
MPTISAVPGELTYTTNGYHTKLKTGLQRMWCLYRGWKWALIFLIISVNFNYDVVIGKNGTFTRDGQGGFLNVSLSQLTGTGNSYKADSGLTLEKYQVCRTRMPEPLLRSTHLTSNGAPMTASVSSLFRFLLRIEYWLSYRCPNDFCPFLFSNCHRAIYWHLSSCLRKLRDQNPPVILRYKSTVLSSPEIAFNRVGVSRNFGPT